jgi:hypothetical protein
MAFQMVDRDQRLARGKRQRFGRHQPDHDTADQPRPGRRGDRIDLGERHAGLRHRAFDQGH